MTQVPYLFFSSGCSNSLFYVLFLATIVAFNILFTFGFLLTMIVTPTGATFH